MSAYVSLVCTALSPHVECGDIETTVGTGTNGKNELQCMLKLVFLK